MSQNENSPRESTAPGRASDRNHNRQPEKGAEAKGGIFKKIKKMKTRIKVVLRKTRGSSRRSNKEKGRGTQPPAMKVMPLKERELQKRRESAKPDAGGGDGENAGGCGGSDRSGTGHTDGAQTN